MTQTWALLVDAYRELNSKKLFWITLILSAIVVLACGMAGINEKGITFLHWQFETPFFTTEIMSRANFYKMIFASMAIPIWLTWVATVLALVSTGGIFPDFIASGSIELTLSKPIGRWRLFLTKYGTGLLFAGLQVLVFSLASFLVIGVRGGSWEWGLFLAVPIVVVFFSYLFSICVLFGIVTKSTIASILLTLLMWFGISMMGAADGMLMMFRTQAEFRAEDGQKKVERLEKTLASQRAELADVEGAGGDAMSAEDREAKIASLTGRIGNTERSLASAREDVTGGERAASQIEPWYRGVIAARTVLPKTGDTIGLLQRWLVDTSQLPGMNEDGPVDSGESIKNGQDPRVQKRIQEQVTERPVWWVVGTSLGFEAVVLLGAGWMFARRDF
ncbi:MAG: ABC transporter permease [Phycisphaerales bacterium]